VSGAALEHGGHGIVTGVSGWASVPERRHRTDGSRRS